MEVLDIKIISNIINKYQNKKILKVRKENKNLRNIITYLLVFIQDRKEMDQRNLDRAYEIEKVHFIHDKKPELSYAHTEELINETKGSIVASETLLNQMDKYKSSTYNFTSFLEETQDEQI